MSFGKDKGEEDQEELLTDLPVEEIKISNEQGTQDKDKLSPI